MRVIVEIVVPLVLPTVLYILWVLAVRRAGAGRTAAWQKMPFLWLAAAGVVLLALFLVVMTVGFGTDTRGSVYVPAQYKNGRIIPGHFEPAEKP